MQRRWNFPGYRYRRASMAPRAAMARLGLCDNWNHSKTGAFGGEIGCHKSARRSRKKRIGEVRHSDAGVARLQLRIILKRRRFAHWNHSKEGGGKIRAVAHIYKRGLRKIFQKNQTCITQTSCTIIPQFPCLCRASRIFSVYEFQNIQSPVRQRQRPQGS